MVSAEIPATAPSTTVGTPTTDNGAAGSGDFVAMLTQLLGGADAGLPATASVDAVQSADASVDATTPDGAPVDSALADALSAMLANAPPIISQAIAQFIAERTPSSVAIESSQSAMNGQTVTGAISSQGIAMTGRMLADSATDIARNSQTILQGVLNSDAKANSTDSSAAQADGGATPDGSNPASGINATNSAKSDQVTSDVQLKERVGTGPWRDELGARLTWMVERGVQTGSLRLSPEHLGPLEVRITVQNDQATVWFGAAHADTRASLEQALPRLRELFAASGLSLADAGVFREPPREAFKNNSGNYSGSNSLAGEGGVAIVGARNGLLDAYA